MYCRQCGTQVPDDSVFCHVCGARVLGAETKREGTSAPATPPAPEAAAAPTMRGYCERCGQELGVNEKMRGLTVHQQCPTPAPEAPPEAVAPEGEAPAPTAPVRATEVPKREEIGAQVSPPPPEATSAHTRRGYCERCGQELGVNEKMRGLTVHQECPTPAPVAPPSPAHPSPLLTPTSGVVPEQPPARQPDEMFCQSCRAIIRREARFCAHCGASVGRAPVAAPAPVEQRDVVGVGRYILNFFLAGLIGLGLTYLLRNRGWTATWICLAILVVVIIALAAAGG